MGILGAAVLASALFPGVGAWSPGALGMEGHLALSRSAIRTGDHGIGVPSERIYGGEDISLEENIPYATPQSIWQAQTGLGYPMNETGTENFLERMGCSATILSPEWAITAGHCVTQCTTTGRAREAQASSGIVPPGFIRVGHENINDPTDGYRVPITGVHVHPKWLDWNRVDCDSGLDLGIGMGYDVALLKLDMDSPLVPEDLRDSIPYARLPGDDTFISVDQYLLNEPGGCDEGNHDACTTMTLVGNGVQVRKLRFLTELARGLPFHLRSDFATASCACFHE